MELHPLMAKAGSEIVRIAHGTREEDFAASTPCEKYDVRALLNHLLYWAPVLELAARKQSVPTDRPAEGDQDLTDGEWRNLLAERVQRLVTAWADESAWAGSTSMGGGEFPASVAGSMTLVEFVVHGWDLARATGQPFDCDDDVAQGVYTVLSGMAEQGRAMGAFGPEVTVPESAPVLDRALGTAGRDPNWTA
jgi:uncharacterized protein (TIGR03086 family)